MTSPLEDFAAAITALSKSTVFLNRVYGLTARSNEIGRAWAEDGDVAFLLNGNKTQTPASKHILLQVTQERAHAEEQSIRAFKALRALCPAFDNIHFSAEILIGTPTNQHPRVHLRMFGRAITNSEHPVQLPRTLAALALPQTELGALGSFAGRLFKVETAARYPKPIPAHTPEDALRIHAALCNPDLLETFTPVVKISEVLNAVSITKAMLARRKVGEMAET